MKIKELRLLNTTVKKDDNIIFQGTTEDMPENLKEQEYKKIYFEGVNVIIEIQLCLITKYKLYERK